MVPGGVELYWQELGGPWQALAVGPRYVGVRETRLGFGLNRAPRGPSDVTRVPWARHGTLRVPLWFPLLATAALPAVALWRWRARRPNAAAVGPVGPVVKR